jgi:arginine deiminase
MAVQVTSEIGRLHEVLIHPPGAELLAVTPSTRADYLYDDIMEVTRAQREHRRFVAVLERFARVHHVRDLLAEVLADDETRKSFIKETLDIIPSEPLSRDEPVRSRPHAHRGKGGNPGPAHENAQ